MNDALVRKLGKVGFLDVNQVGGKAASLGELLVAGIPVPDGFVVTTIGFHRGMTKELEKAIYTAFDRLGSSRVAVRSSAIAEDSDAASWAGQLESYLNVDREGLPAAVEKCWQSVKLPRAVEYAKEHGVRDNAVAVVVQAMVDADISGVLFTANPVSNDTSEILVEAAVGLGELLVQGEITPETIVATRDGEAKSRQASRQHVKLVYQNDATRRVDMLPPEQLVSGELLEELVRVGVEIEKHYDKPQDVEWAVQDGRLYVVQSRPISTLAEPQGQKYLFKKEFVREESLIVNEIAAQEVDRWLSQLVKNPPPSMLFVNRDGLTEIWFEQEAIRLLVDLIYRRNVENGNYLPTLVKSYKQTLVMLHQYELRKSAQDMEELKRYLELFRQAVLSLHIVFFTLFHPETPAKTRKLAEKIRGQDALFDNADFYIRESLEGIFPRLAGSEAFMGLRDLDVPDYGRVKKRENDFVLYQDRYLTMSFPTFSHEHPELIFKTEEVDQKQRVLMGTPAFAGQVQGLAQVVSRKKEIPAFQPGNVLVAPMTTPHYLPAMRRCIAIITDEGGVTSHAAIVARELKKPCIIGTKFATHLIQDGDEVDVNADLGEIRITKKAR